MLFRSPLNRAAATSCSPTCKGTSRSKSSNLSTANRNCIRKTAPATARSFTRANTTTSQLKAFWSDPAEGTAIKETTKILKRSTPQCVSDVSGLKPLGRVCEVQAPMKIEDFETPANSGLPFDGKARKKVQVWWPVWTEITPVATAQISLPQ